MATKPPGAVPGGKLGRMVGGRRALLVGGGAVAVVVVVALIRRQSQASGGGASTTASPAAYDSTLSDYYAQFETQLEQIQSQVAGLTQPGGTSGSPSSNPPVTAGPGGPIIPIGNAHNPPPTVQPPVPVSHPADSFTQAIYKVVGGDTLSSIAAKYGETWQEVYNYNLKAGVRPAATQATLKQRGPNLIYSGESIYIPNKG